LSELLGTVVHVHTHPASFRATGEQVLDPFQYTTLEDTFSQEELGKMLLDTYNETPELLWLEEPRADGVVSEEVRWHSSLLKSNCRVTSQPDWGDVYIMYKAQTHVSPESLLSYLVSFRDECHFHEEICETIYKRLYDVLSPEELVVTCLYARRGGIDINPVRASNAVLIERECGDLIDPFVMHVKTAKQ
jgi:7-cyano-7-deazaguanine reductase